MLRVLTIWLCCTPSAIGGEVAYASFQSPLGFVLEESTLSDIQQRYGDADEFEISEGHHDFGICYESRDSAAIVVFASNSELGGPDKGLMGVEIHAKNKYEHPCSPSELQSSELIIGKMKLGMALADFKALSSVETRSLNDGYFDQELTYLRPLSVGEIEEHRAVGFSEEHIPEEVYVALKIWCQADSETAIGFGVWQHSSY